MSEPRLSSAFSHFRQKHQGEAVLVCGCGHSLRQLREPPQLLTIGVNDVGRLFDPTYLLVVNRPGDFSGDRYAYVRNSKSLAVFSPFPQKLEYAPQVYFNLGERSGTNFDDPKGLPFTRNSPYVALCLAAFMGARRIGLLGVDFTAHHFFAPSGTHPLSRELPRMDREYAKLLRAFRSKGIEVFNVSDRSRLTAFPKKNLSTFFAEQEQHRNNTSPSIWAHRPQRNPRLKRSLNAMEVSVEKRTHGLVGQCMETLARCLKNMGAKVTRVSPRSPHHAPVTFVWNGRNVHAPGAVIHCEHGWLPRWYFQMSPLGINADSHCSPFFYDGKPLESSNRQLVEHYLAQLKITGPSGYMDVTSIGKKRLPKAFLLVPLQMEGDTNLQRHVPSNLRRMQKWIDYVSWHNPNLPLLIKQHPADARQHNQHLQLKPRRKGDFLVPHRYGNIHQLLKSGRCRGIISLNSNVVHDGMIWDVPAVALGRNIWPREGASPFLQHIPRDFRELEDFHQQQRDCREAYCLHLIRSQWSLADLSSPEKLIQFFHHCTQWLERQTA